MKIFQSINPYDQSLVAEYPVLDHAGIELSLRRAEMAFANWRKTTIKLRSDLLLQLAVVLRKNKETYAHTISREMGKILKESRAEVEKCAVCCEYYATHGEEILRDELLSSDAKRSFISFDPIGAIFAIMPWNFPFWQVIRFAAPTIMAGNVVLLKHAKNVTGCSLHIETAFLEAGFPEHVFQSLVIESSSAEKIIQHPVVQGVTLTGSETAGSSVASLAGRYIKKSVLELGGSDAFIVLEDADINKAAKIATLSRMQNAGQSCIAAKRMIVVSSVMDDFIHALKNKVEQIRQGNQLDENISMGPVSSIGAADTIESQQKLSLQYGASVISGGNREGANYMPTILANVKIGMPAYEEELFGPVASVITAIDADDAIRIANDHRYGLGAAIFTNDLDKANYYARQIQSGGVFVNTMVKSDPRLPFGGIKKSGYGRELSYYGIREFTNVKTIVISDE